MKKFIYAVLGLALLIIFLVFSYPTNIPTSTYVGKSMSDDGYAKMKEQIFRFATDHERIGMMSRGAAGPAGTAALYCQGIPMITLIKAPQATVLMLFRDLAEQSPEAAELADKLREILKQGGQVTVTPAPKSDGWLNSTILEFRDKVSLTARCK